MVTLSDSDAAAAFDAEHGGLEVRCGWRVAAAVLPADAPPPSRPPGPTIRQLIPAGRTDTAFFNNDEDFQCRVVCYALVEQPSGATQVDAVIARGPEDDLDDGQQLQLASVYRREQQLATWAMRPSARSHTRSSAFRRRSTGCTRRATASVGCSASMSRPRAASSSATSYRARTRRARATS